MSKQVELPLDVAKEMYTHGSIALSKFALANYTKEELEAKELPKTWKDLEIISGYAVNLNSASIFHDGSNADCNRNVFATKEQAEAVIAMAQLSQLMKVYHNGWSPNWDGPGTKYCILIKKGVIELDTFAISQQFLAFENPKIREEFLKNFRDLIMQAKPLL